MRTPLQHLTLFVVAVAGWIQRDQQAAIVYLLEENRVLKARLCGRKLRLTDDEQRRLAVKGKALRRKLLAEVAGIVTPEGDVPAAVEFGRVGAAPVNTLRQQTHRCQEISVCF